MLSLIVSILFSVSVQASVSVNKGHVVISASGADATYYGGNGQSAGKAAVTLSYTDATKTMVNIAGTIEMGGAPKNFTQQILLKDLVSIEVLAQGGDGASGQPGQDGWAGQDGQDGSQGWPGFAGCPPGMGGQGGNGGNGTNGSAGTNGGDGGNGGAGGTVTVSTSADQSELLLFVKTSVAGGSGGYGGSGGAGGRGGRGGQGGAGGPGGNNTCTDANGNPTGGFPGSQGFSGSNGSDGWAGSDGMSGNGGYSGKNGARNILVGGQSYSGIFQLEVGGMTLIDDTGDGLLEPGEKAYLTSLTLTNKGPMPSPAGQSIKVNLSGTATLTLPQPMTANFAEIAAGATQTLTFKKGDVTLQVPDNAKLIGQKVTLGRELMINNVSMSGKLDSGLAIGWPLSLSFKKSVDALFDIQTDPVQFSLKNVGAADIGPQASQGLVLQVEWISKQIPAQDVDVIWPDGRRFNLAQPVQVTDFTVPAKSTAALPVSVFFRDSKKLAKGIGQLKVSLRMTDLSNSQPELVQAVAATINVKLDLKSLAWNQLLDLNAAKITCQFTTPAMERSLSSLQITKTKGANRLTAQLAVADTSGILTSPLITMGDATMLSYFETLNVANPAPQEAVDFLNKVVSPSAPKGAWAFKGCKVNP